MTAQWHGECYAGLLMGSEESPSKSLVDACEGRWPTEEGCSSSRGSLWRKQRVM